MRESTGRAIRIEQLKERIQILADTHDEVNEKELIANFSLSWNLSERKVKEYLSLLILSGFCERTQKGILPREHADLERSIRNSIELKNTPEVESKQ